MLHNLVFSKDRPLQLQAYLDSLYTLSNVYPNRTTVLVSDKKDYDGLENWANVVDESQCGGFDTCLREYVAKLEDGDHVFFGCDDVVFTRPFSTNYPQMFLDTHPTVLGFSLRLGRNIIPRPPSINDTDSNRPFYLWNWQGLPSHWGYPFELMASIYRGSLVKEIVLGCKDPIASPNHLESYGTLYCMKHKAESNPTLAMFNTDNYAVACDVNRVQHVFQNKFDGTTEHDPENLKELFRCGKRLDWSRLFGIRPSDCFVGMKYWSIV